MHMVNEYASPSAICRTLVLKYGGNAMPAEGEPDLVLAELAQLWRAGTRLVLVHGGGPEIDAELALRGIRTHRVEGLRVTDAGTLAVTEAVLCGTLNKRLVRACAALGVPAAGISGQDGSVLLAQREQGPNGADLGYVGRVETVDVRLLETLLNGGFLPVVAPLAVEPRSGHGCRRLRRAHQRAARPPRRCRSSLDDRSLHARRRAAFFAEPSLR
jgi:acetylglutamate kinase